MGSTITLNSRLLVSRRDLYIILRRPDLRDQLRQTNIICIELINTDKHANSRCSQCPGRDRANDREFALV